MPLYIKSSTAVCACVVIIVHMVLSFHLCHSLTQMVWVFVVSLLFLSICLFMRREYVCTQVCHHSAQAAVVASSGKREGGRDREADRLVIFWNARTFPILKSSSSSRTTLFVSLAHCIVNRSWGHISAHIYMRNYIHSHIYRKKKR